MKHLYMIQVNDYDYNNTGQIVTYYKRPSANISEGREYHDWEIDILESEGYEIAILKTITLHLD